MEYQDPLKEEEPQPEEFVPDTSTEANLEQLEEPTVDLAELIYNAEIIEHMTQVGKIEEEGDKSKSTEPESSVLFKVEEMPEGERVYARNLNHSFTICRRFMSALGRIPIRSRSDKQNAIKFSYNLKSFGGVLFFITSFLLILITILSTINLLSTMLNFPFQPDKVTVTVQHKVIQSDGEINWEPLTPWHDIPMWAVHTGNSTTYVKKDVLLRAEEMFIFRRNLASMIFALFLLYHIIIGDISMFRRRGFIVSYLTFWTESVEIMRIDVSGSARAFCQKFLIYFILWFILFLFLLLANFAPIASGAPVSFVFLWARAAYPQIHTSSELLILIFRAVGGFVYMYIVLCSKVYIFFFLYICKLLTTACTVWNERLETIFTTAERVKTRTQKMETRTGYDHLFKDYVNLLDLLNGCDILFQNIIESYFCVTLMSCIFEVYYLVRPITSDQTDFKHARTLDMGIIAIYLFNTIIMFFLVTSGAAEVGGAAGNGLEIIRRQGIMGHRTDEEMHFMISLYMSYSGHFDSALKSAGYFLLNKALLIGIAGAMISYIIIIFQFKPSLGLSSEEQQTLLGIGSDDVKDVFKVKSLVLSVENTFLYFKDRQPGS